MGLRFYPPDALKAINIKSMWDLEGVPKILKFEDDVGTFNRNIRKNTRS